MVYSVTISGETPAKKNSKQIIINKKTHKPMIISSDRYTQWHKGAETDILMQRHSLPSEPIDRPVIILLKFFHGDKRRRDSDNGASSILDLLVDNQVIADDSWQIVQTLHISNAYDKANARCEVIIQEADIC